MEDCPSSSDCYKNQVREKVVFVYKFLKISPRKISTKLGIKVTKIRE